MLAFEISINGKKLCLVGTDMLVSGMGISWARRQPDDIYFNVGGLIQERQHARWNTPRLQVGDEVTIRLVDVDSADAPDMVYDPALENSP